MHEMALAEGVLQLVEAAACAERAARITRVVLEIGGLASVEPEALSFCFEAVARGTMAQGAALDIVEVPGEGRCEPCARTVPMRELYGACPICGGYPLQPTGGTEMRVREIEIE